MPKTKRTITRDSVFRPSSEPASLPRQGAPERAKATRQTAVWLADDETDWLDAQCQRVRKGGWRAVTRSAYIRALIQASMTRQVDLTDVGNERQLTERLTRSDQASSSTD